MASPFSSSLLDDLPRELLENEIFPRAHPTSLVSLSLTCRTFSHLKSSHLFPRQIIKELPDGDSQHKCLALLESCLAPEIHSSNLFRYFVEALSLKSFLHYTHVVYISSLILKRRDFETLQWFLEFDIPFSLSPHPLIFEAIGSTADLDLVNLFDDFFPVPNHKLMPHLLKGAADSGNLEFLQTLLDRCISDEDSQAIHGAFSNPIDYSHMVQAAWDSDSFEVLRFLNEHHGDLIKDGLSSISKLIIPTRAHYEIVSSLNVLPYRMDDWDSSSARRWAETGNIKMINFALKDDSFFFEEEFNAMTALNFGQIEVYRIIRKHCPKKTLQRLLNRTWLAFKDVATLRFLMEEDLAWVKAAPVPLQASPGKLEIIRFAVEQKLEFDCEILIYFYFEKVSGTNPSDPTELDYLLSLTRNHLSKDERLVPIIEFADIPGLKWIVSQLGKSKVSDLLFANKASALVAKLMRFFQQGSVSGLKFLFDLVGSAIEPHFWGPRDKNFVTMVENVDSRIMSFLFENHPKLLSEKLDALSGKLMTFLARSSSNNSLDSTPNIISYVHFAKMGLINEVRQKSVQTLLDLLREPVLEKPLERLKRLHKTFRDIGNSADKEAGALNMAKWRF